MRRRDLYNKEVNVICCVTSSSTRWSIYINLLTIQTWLEAITFNVHHQCVSMLTIANENKTQRLTEADEKVSFAGIV